MKKYNFNDPDDFKELERMAYDCSIDIADFPPAAYRYFDKLRILYAEYKYDNMPIDKARKIKTKLYADYKTALSDYERWCEAHRNYQDNIRTVTVIMTDIEKSSDLNEIAYLACQAVSLMTGDENFLKRQASKFKSERQEGEV